MEELPMNNKPKCVLCDSDSITTVAHIRVCEAHEREYMAEAAKYLPDHERQVWSRLCEADDATRRKCCQEIRSYPLNPNNYPVERVEYLATQHANQRVVLQRVQALLTKLVEDENAFTMREECREVLSEATSVLSGN